MPRFPQERKTSRVISFWDTPPASKLLKNDEEEGIAKDLKPAQLWASREEYKDFPCDVFRKHIYQERNKQLAGEYWVYKQNKQKDLENAEEVKVMKYQWHEFHLNDAMKEVLE